MKHKISIIIPVYGVEPYIEDCLKSVASQDYEGPLECIIVDDRGPDKSMEIVDKFTSEYNGSIDFKTVIREKNGGLSAARNSGLEAATGEYVYFLDSDDEITESCIKLLVSALELKEFDIVVGNFVTTKPLSDYIKLKLPDNKILTGKEVFREFADNNWYMMAVNKLYNRRFLIGNGLRFYEGILHEDELWSFEVASIAKSLCVVDKICYIYKVREGSIMTTSAMQRKANSFVKIACEMFLFAKNHNLIDDFRVYNYTQSWFISAFTKSGKISADVQKNTYLTLRNVYHINLIDYIKMTKLNPKRLVRDFHLLCSEKIGYIIYKSLFK